MVTASVNAFSIAFDTNDIDKEKIGAYSITHQQKKKTEKFQRWVKSLHAHWIGFWFIVVFFLVEYVQCFRRAIIPFVIYNLMWISTNEINIVTKLKSFRHWRVYTAKLKLKVWALWKFNDFVSFIFLLKAYILFIRNEKSCNIIMCVCVYMYRSLEFRFVQLNADVVLENQIKYETVLKVNWFCFIFLLFLLLL